MVSHPPYTVRIHTHTHTHTHTHIHTDVPYPKPYTYLTSFSAWADPFRPGVAAMATSELRSQSDSSMISPRELASTCKSEEAVVCENGWMLGSVLLAIYKYS